MEIQFHQQQKGKMSKFKGKNNSNNKFVGVRQRPSGRWVAEIKDTTQKIRMWLGTFETAEAAARAYDEAACLLRGSKTRTNFVTHVSDNSPLASRIKNLLNSKKKTEEKQSQKQCLDIASNNTTSTSSVSSSSTSSGGDFSCVGKVNDHTQLCDDSYKPDLSICNDDFDLGFSYRSNNMSWGLGFAQEMLELPKNGNIMAEMSSAEMEFSEFERMKVERQISASLYAMNGVQEYMETVHDPNEAIWDLPALCSLFC